MKDKPTNIQEVELMAAQAGITFTAEDYEGAYRVAEQRRAQIEAEQAARNRKGFAVVIDRFNRLFPRLLKALFGIGDVATVSIRTLLLGPGILIVLGAILYVEVTRVERGVALFEVRPDVGLFSSIAMVLLNLVLELTIGYTEHRAGWLEPPAHEFSLRLTIQRLGYIFGRSTGWTPRQKSPAHHFRLVLKLVAVTILALALSGTMHDMIKQESGSWFEGLKSIVFGSSLSDMTTWIVSLLFSLAIVISAQRLTNYVSRRAIEISMALTSDVAIEAAGSSSSAHLLARLKAVQRERRASASAAYLSRIENVIAVPTIPETAETVEETKELSPSVKRVLKWLDRNDTTGMSLQQMADAAKTSKTTMYRAVQERKERGS